jgi:hypothetical protein
VLSEKIVVPWRWDVVLSKKITVPMEKITVPMEKIIVPIEKIIVPMEKIIVPMEKITVPTEKITVPSEKITVPTEKIVVPSRWDVVLLEKIVESLSRHRANTSEFSRKKAKEGRKGMRRGAEAGSRIFGRRVNGVPTSVGFFRTPFEGVAQLNKVSSYSFLVSFVIFVVPVSVFRITTNPFRSAKSLRV